LTYYIAILLLSSTVLQVALVSVDVIRNCLSNEALLAGLLQHTNHYSNRTRFMPTPESY